MAPKKARDLGQDLRFTRAVEQFSTGHKTVGQMVYAVLRQAILAGAFAPGEWLRQESLAEAIGVSRIPVRTALLQLESEGLLDFHPHRGARLRTLSIAQIEEIYRLRVLLETVALRRSMSVMTAKRVASLRRLADQLDENPEPSEFMDLRVRFYRELYDAASNPLLVQMIEELRSHVARYLLALTPSQLHIGEHAELITYVDADDVERAERWITAYLERAREYITEAATTDAEPTVGELTSVDDTHPA